MLDHADNLLRAYGNKDISLSKGFKLSAKRQLLKLRFLAELSLESLAVARDFLNVFDLLCDSLSYGELKRWAEVGLEFTRRDKRVGQIYFQTGTVKLPQLTAKSRLLIFDLLHRGAQDYQDVSSKGFQDALEAIEKLPGKDTTEALLQLCWERSSLAPARAFALLKSCADTIGAMDLTTPTNQALLAHGLTLLGDISQKSASKAQEFFEQLKPVFLATRTDEERVVKLYDRLIQGADRLTNKSDHLALTFFTSGVELARLKNERTVKRWVQLFAMVTEPRTKVKGVFQLLQDTAALMDLLKHVLAELEEIASREDNEQVLDIVLDQVLRVAERDVDTAFQCLIASPRVLRRMALDNYPRWVERGFATAANNAKKFAAYFGFESQQSQQMIEAESGGVSLNVALPTLRLYIEGLSGRSFSITGAKEIPPLTGIGDGKTITLPDVVKKFDRRKDNFRLYKVLAARAAGQFEFGTYEGGTDELIALKKQLEDEFRGGRRAPLGSLVAKRLLALFPQNTLAERLFTIFEERRIENRLYQAYRGLQRDLEWAGKLRNYRRPEALYLMGYERIIEILYNALLKAEEPEAEKSEGKNLLAAIQTANAFLNHPRATVVDSLRATLSLYQYLAPEPPEESKVPWKDETESPPDQEGDVMKHTPHKPAQAPSSPARLNPITADQNRLVEPGAANGKVTAESDQPVTEQPQQANVFHYDEWDYSLNDYRVAWCTVREDECPRAEPAFVTRTRARYGGELNSIRHQFQMLRAQGVRRVGRQLDGDDFDLQAVVDGRIDRKSGNSPSEKIYMQRLRRERDVAVLILVDMSSSTSRIIDSETHRRIIDLEKEALVLMSAALEAIGDSYAIYGFSSHGREKVTAYYVKRFAEAFTISVERRLAGIKPLVNTRLGAALRHATARLAAEPRRTKLLIVLSDGKPFDHGAYELSRYSDEDIHRALIEAKRQKITPFCITIDKEEEKDLKRMYGEVGYTVVNNILTLPERLPGIYRRLTT